MLKPTHNLVVKTEDSDKHIQVGVAWENNGYLTIKLNTGVSLRWDDPFVIRLFKADHYQKGD